MISSERDAVLAAVRLVLVVGLLVFSLGWWFLQKAPDYRVEQRIRLAPSNQVRRIGPASLDHEDRDAWNLLVGQPARFHVIVPGEDAAVRFHAGYLQGHPEMAVHMVRANGQRVELAVVPGSEAKWTMHRLPVPAEPDEEIDLEFLALDGKGRPGLGAMLLADVVLESAGRPVDETENPVMARALSIDLLADSAIDRVRAPGTAESARMTMPGPECMPLEEHMPLVLELDQVPSGAQLNLVLHAAQLGEGDPQPGSRVIITADDLVLGNVPVDAMTEADEGQSPARELLLTTDLLHWAGRPLTLQFELRGGAGLFVGVRDAYITEPQARPRRPFDPEKGMNVLLVIIDGLRADRLGYAGHDPAHTPVMDSLARSGLTYEHVVAPSSWSLPNVATLLTGVQPLTHGLGLRPERVLSPRLSTLAQSAGWAGFMTGCFSSSGVIGPHTGLDRGYETFEWAPLPATSLVERAIDWLEDASQFEWFLTLHLSDPTSPHEPQLRDVLEVEAEVDEQLIARLRNLDSRPGIAEAMATEIGPLYDAEVAGVDRALGTVMTALEERGLAENTLVVVVGSHGLEFFEHRGRSQGQTLFDEVLRVPLLVSGPGVVGLAPPPLVEREMVEMVDVTQLIGELGRLMTAVHLPGRIPPPFGPSDQSLVSHSVLMPFEGVTRSHLEASRREGLMLLTDQTTGDRFLYDITPGPGRERDLLVGPEATRWTAETRALGEAFDDWYRTTILTSAARAVLWEP